MINKETSRLSVFATVLGLILSASNVFALIGENHEQSEIRYGPPVKREGHWLTYIKNNLKIKQHFEEDLVDDVIYTKLDDKTKMPIALTFEEIAIILDSNSKGQLWRWVNSKGQEYRGIAEDNSRGKDNKEVVIADNASAQNFSGRYSGIAVGKPKWHENESIAIDYDEEHRTNDVTYGTNNILPPVKNAWYCRVWHLEGYYDELSRQLNVSTEGFYDDEGKEVIASAGQLAEHNSRMQKLYYTRLQTLWWRLWQHRDRVPANTLINTLDL